MLVVGDGVIILALLAGCPLGRIKKIKNWWYSGNENFGYCTLPGAAAAFDKTNNKEYVLLKVSYPTQKFTKGS